MAALNHPNVVAVYDVGKNFLVSELVDGQTLRAGGKLSQRQAINLAVQIAEGIAAAHAAGITHRDLKPDNIMVTRPEAEDVRTVIGGQTFHLLRRQVADRTYNHAVLRLCGRFGRWRTRRSLLRHLGEAEIQDLGAALAGDHDVVGL